MVRSSLHPNNHLDAEASDFSRNSLRLPKISTASNTFEMAELLR